MKRFRLSVSCVADQRPGLSRLILADRRAVSSLSLVFAHLKSNAAVVDMRPGCGLCLLRGRGVGEMMKS